MRKPSSFFDSVSFYFLLFFYILVALDFHRIPFATGNHPRALADLVVLSGIFVYLFKLEELSFSRKLTAVLTAFLVRLIAFSGRGVFFRGDAVFSLAILEVWLLLALLILKDWRSFLLLAFHPLAFVFAGGWGGVYTLSIGLFFVAEALVKKGTWPARTARVLEAVAGALSFGGSLIFVNNLQVRRRLFPEVVFFLTLVPFLYFVNGSHFLVHDVTAWFTSTPCASVFNLLTVGESGFIRILAFISVVASIFQRSIQGALFFLLFFSPFPVDGTAVISLYGWAVDKGLPLKFYSFAFLLTVAAGEWFPNLCMLPLPIFIVVYGGFFALYLREVFANKK